MLNNSKIEWERASISTKSHRGGKSLTGVVKLKKNDKGLYHQVIIASDLIDGAAWKAGDTVWLYSSGDTLFKLTNESSDFKLAKPNKTTHSLIVRSQPLAQAIHGKGQADIYMTPGLMEQISSLHRREERSIVFGEIRL